jgi:ribose transport system permease protein
MNNTTKENRLSGPKVSSLLGNKVISMSIVLFVLCVIAFIMSPYFLTGYNLSSVIRDLAFMGMVAIAQACLLLLGELDLSVGSMAALCGVIGGFMMVFAHMDPFLSMVLCVLIGGGFGFINGTIITRLNLNALVVTIGMSGVYSGINLVITKGKAVTQIPESIYFMGSGDFLYVPMPFVFCIIVLVVIIFIIKKTPFGRYVYAIGNNNQAASILGIDVKTVRTTIYIIVGMVSALAGMLMVARLGSSQPTIGSTWAMNSIAASVIGGVALTGGIGNPAGALIGGAIICVIQNIIVLTGVSSYWQSVVSGTVVVIAIAIDPVADLVREARAKRHQRLPNQAL